MDNPGLLAVTCLAVAFLALLFFSPQERALKKETAKRKADAKERNDKIDCLVNRIIHLGVQAERVMGSGRGTEEVSCILKELEDLL